jgi:hypothetical protein
MKLFEAWNYYYTRIQNAETSNVNAGRLKRSKNGFKPNKLLNKFKKNTDRRYDGPRGGSILGF